MPSIFSKIVAGQIPCHKVAETELYLAFLDISPLAKGHTLVIPKQEVDYLFDLDDQLLSGLMLFAKQVAKAIERTVTCQRIWVAVIGLEVPHAHVHLVPMNSLHDLDFSKPRVKLSQEEYVHLAQAIAGNMAK